MTKWCLSLLALLLVFRAEVNGSERYPTFGPLEYSRLTKNAAVFVARVESVQQKVLVKNQPTLQSLQEIEKALLKRLGKQDAELKKFVEESHVVTSFTLRVESSLMGTREKGELLTFTIIDEVGSLCPLHYMLPLRDGWEKKAHVWAIDTVNGPLGVKVASFAWTTKEKWREMKD